MTYTFAQHNMLFVLDHANTLDIVVISLNLSGAEYTMETDVPFPEDQRVHLELTTV